MKMFEKLGKALQTVHMLILPGTFVYSNNKGVSNIRPGNLSKSLIQPIRLEHDAKELRRNFIVLPLVAYIKYQSYVVLCYAFHVLLKFQITFENMHMALKHRNTACKIDIYMPTGTHTQHMGLFTTD
jgi:hypothetical protein